MSIGLFGNRSDIVLNQTTASPVQYWSDDVIIIIIIITYITENTFILFIQ